MRILSLRACQPIWQQLWPRRPDLIPMGAKMSSFVLSPKKLLKVFVYFVLLFSVGAPLGPTIWSSIFFFAAILIWKKLPNPVPGRSKCFKEAAIKGH